MEDYNLIEQMTTTYNEIKGIRVAIYRTTGFQEVAEIFAPCCFPCLLHD